MKISKEVTQKAPVSTPLIQERKRMKVNSNFIDT
jgi:hypothetical protein